MNNQRAKARKILRNNGMNDVLDKVCSVMKSITENGITEYSSQQEWKTYVWGERVLYEKYNQILKNTEKKLHRDLSDEFNNLRDIFLLTEARVDDEIDEWLKQQEAETKRLVFAIDVDNVLRDNLGEMVKLYNEHFNDTKDVSTITNYKTEIEFPKIEEETGQTSSKWFFQDHSHELFVEAKPFNYVSEDIKKLKEYGDIVIVTYQKTPLNKQQTLEWLEKNCVEYDSIVFAKDKSIVDCDYFIDDNDWNFKNCKAEHGVLIAAPYNTNVNLNELSKTTKFGCEIEKFDSFHDFVENFIKEQNK
jgi:5'(3')-deoxyribonucleotidase